jgi:hypothetical protein
MTKGAKNGKPGKLGKTAVAAEPDSQRRVLKPETEELRLSATEARALMTICVELLDFCARVSGKIDPTAAMMVTWARDEVTIPVFGVRA